MISLRLKICLASVLALTATSTARAQYFSAGIDYWGMAFYDSVWHQLGFYHGAFNYFYPAPYMNNNGFSIPPYRDVFYFAGAASHLNTGNVTRPAVVAGNAELAAVKVLAPTADAAIWFDNRETQSRGPVRSFTSPPLVRGREFQYRVRARWNVGGKPIEQTQVVVVRAGQEAVVDFRQPVPAVTPKN